MHRYPLVFAAALSFGCASATNDEAPSTRPVPVSTNFERLPLVLTGIKNTRDVSLHEGLPSEFWEPELLEKERKRKPTIVIRGYSFYEEPLVLDRTAAERLTSLLSARKSFRPQNAQKSCGDFHPDYAVAWGTGDEATVALICLECGDVKIFSPQSDLHCDIGPDPAATLADLLRPYRKNRPVAKPGQ